MKKILGIILLFLFLLVFTTPTYADIGAPMIFITLPMLIIGLIPIILIETFILIRKLNIAFKIGINVSAIMNIVSTIFGIPITWGALVLMQMLTGGGPAYGIETPLKKFLAVTWQAPWLMPYESNLYWMIPAASLVLLIPFFFASYLVEFFVARKMLKQIDKTLIKRSVFLANLCSYSILLILAIIWLITSIMIGKQI